MTLKARVLNTEGSAAKAIAETIARAVNAGTFAEKGVATAARLAILVASVAKALVAQEAAVISAADRVVVVAFRVDAHPAKVDLALDREMDLVLPAMGTGNPVRLTIKRTTLSTGFTP